MEVFGLVIMVTIVNWRLVLPILVLAMIFVKFRQIYLKTSRSIKRIEATSIYI